MADLEGIVNSLVDKGKNREEIIERLVLEYLTFKDISTGKARVLANAVYDEVMNSRDRPEDTLIDDILEIPVADVTMNEFGVGCRGKGDFFLHREMADLLYSKGSVLSPRDQDDAGIVRIPEGEDFIVCSVDGTHSRLSDFPFIAGFHVTRAALRDVFVKGGMPVGLIDDVHLADDGDVGKLIDFLAGVSCVAELNDVPIIAGSTLRIGGDMVIGNRMVSCVSAIGVCESPSIMARSDIRVGDRILLTEGAGGGTIATMGIYSGNSDIIKETLNVDFTTACKAIFDSGLHKEIHAMLDVTNGGLRGDANEVCASTGLGLVFEEEKIEKLVNERVLCLLNKLGVDHLGVSLDSLLVFCPPGLCDNIIEVIHDVGVDINIVGEVVKDPSKATLTTKDGQRIDMKPLFRESAYTQIKKIIGERTPSEEERYKQGIRRSTLRARDKIEKVVEFINLTFKDN